MHGARREYEWYIVSACATQWIDWTAVRLPTVMRPDMNSVEVKDYAHPSTLATCGGTVEQTNMETNLDSEQEAGRKRSFSKGPASPGGAKEQPAEKQKTIGRRCVWPIWAGLSNWHTPCTIGTFWNPSRLIQLKPRKSSRLWLIESLLQMTNMITLATKSTSWNKGWQPWQQANKVEMGDLRLTHA